MQTSILKTQNLTKKYHRVTAINNVSINIQKGDIYGLVGENGAGKTTLIRLITSLALPTSGSIELFSQTSYEGLNLGRKRMGTIVEESSFFPFFTAHDNLEYYRIQHGIPGRNCIDKALSAVNLSSTGKKKFKHFSLGMKQRLGLALAMMSHPDFLVLDEPINGLDPTGIVEFRNILLKLNQEKDVTILISSHILPELSNLVTRYGFISKGQMIEEITADELKEKCQEYLEVVVDNIEKASVLLETHLDCTNYDILPDNTLRIYDFLKDTPKLTHTLISNGVGLISLTPKGTNLEDHYLSLFGGEKNA